MNFIKPGYYKMRNGEKAYVVGALPPELNAEWPLTGWLEDEGNRSWYLNGRRYGGPYDDKYDLIAPWEEGIDIGEYWVGIFEQDDMAVLCGADQHYHTQEIAASHCPEATAILKVKDWQACLRGERKLIKGEGL